MPRNATRRAPSAAMVCRANGGCAIGRRWDRSRYCDHARRRPAPGTPDLARAAHSRAHSRSAHRRRTALPPRTSRRPAAASESIVRPRWRRRPTAAPAQTGESARDCDRPASRQTAVHVKSLSRRLDLVNADDENRAARSDLDRLACEVAFRRVRLVGVDEDSRPNMWRRKPEGEAFAGRVEK